MTYEQFITEYVVAGKTYTADEVTVLIQQAWVEAINEQVQLEGRCINRKSPWTNCKKQDYHTHHHDCPSPPDRECINDCLHRCHYYDTQWRAAMNTTVGYPSR